MSCRVYYSIMLLLGIAASSLVGCSDTSLVSVSGTVKLDGKPLSQAVVTFEPINAMRPIVGKTDKSGIYELWYSGTKIGCPPGKYIVRIKTESGGYGTDGEPIKTQEIVPDRFNDQSQLVREVTSGANSFDFNLSTEK